MSNPSKQRGTAWETALCRALAWFHPDVRRMPLAGAKDLGDLDLGGRAGKVWAVEAKNRKSIDLAGAVDEANVEAENAEKPWGVALIKRPRKGDPLQGYAVMSIRTWAIVADFAAAEAERRRAA